jgi:hypothetical protein
MVVVALCGGTSGFDEAAAWPAVVDAPAVEAFRGLWRSVDQCCRTAKATEDEGSGCGGGGGVCGALESSIAGDGGAGAAGLYRGVVWSPEDEGPGGESGAAVAS